eukprot:gene6915-7642_t
MEPSQWSAGNWQPFSTSSLSPRVITSSTTPINTVRDSAVVTNTWRALPLALAMVAPLAALADDDTTAAVVSAAADGADLTLSPLFPLRLALDTFINMLTFFFLCRTILSWFPKTNLNDFPFSLAVWPTEPLLQPTRSLVPPAFGVDISPIIWIMVLSFFREIFTGQQGLLVLLER